MASNQERDPMDERAPRAVRLPERAQPPVPAHLPPPMLGRSSAPPAGPRPVTAASRGPVSARYPVLGIKITQLRDDALELAQELPWFTAWPNISSPQFVVRSNRDIVPPVPLGVAILRADGRLGMHEESRLPQVYDENRPWMSFIPLPEPPDHFGELKHSPSWWYREYTDLQDSRIGEHGLGWLRWDDTYAVAVTRDEKHKPILVRLHVDLRHRVRSAIEKLQFAFEEIGRTLQSTTTSFQTRRDVVMYQLQRRCYYLTGNALLPHELRFVFAAFQRALLEAYGLLAFAPYSEAWGTVGSYDMRSKLPAAARGVFTSDTFQALIHVLAGIPVWFLAEATVGQLDLCEAAKQQGLLRLAVNHTYGERRRRRTPQYLVQLEDIEREFVPSEWAQYTMLPPLRQMQEMAEQVPVWDAPRLPSPVHSDGPGPSHAAHERDELDVPNQTSVPSGNTGGAAGGAPDTAGNSAGSGLKKGRKRKRKGKDPRAEESQEDTEKPPTKRRQVFKHKIAEFKPDLTTDAVEMLARSVTLDDPNRSEDQFRMDALPEWYPELYKPARAVIPAVDLSERRQLELGTAAELRIPQRALLTSRAHRLPLSAYFANSNVGAGNIAVALKNWLRVRPFLLRWLDTSPLAQDVGLVSRKWRDLLKGHVNKFDKEETLKRLGLSILFESSEAVSMVQEMDDNEIHNDEMDNEMDEDSPAKGVPSLDNVVENESAPRLLSPNSAPAVSSLNFSTLDVNALSLAEILNKLPYQYYLEHALPEFEAAESTCWPSKKWRQYILWELIELEFRHELYMLDVAIRSSHPDYPQLHADAPEERLRRLCACWGGSSVNPSEDDTSGNALIDARSDVRYKAMTNFVTLMGSWPRTEELLRPWHDCGILNGAQHIIGKQQYSVLESAAWTCYAQVFYDYRHRLAPMPAVRPEPPFPPVPVTQ